MAITAPHYQLFKSLKPLLTQGGTLLEIGEANWYGDIHPFELCDIIDFHDSTRGVNSGDLFAVAKLFYKLTFAPSRIVSIDFHGSPAALRHDLNQPLPLDDLFDLVINHGTAEHVFNIAQVFKTAHDRCEVGGLMIHDVPFTGWIDHGFYCLQPTLFYDLAAANGYEIVKIAVTGIDPCIVLPIEQREQVAALAEAGKIPVNSMLFVVFRKIVGGEFRFPMQGYYARTLSGEGERAWRELR